MRVIKEIRALICEHCGESYERLAEVGKGSRWCSNDCRVAARKIRNEGKPLMSLSKLLSPYRFLELRKQVFAKTGGHCRYCGVPLKLENFRIDHAMPLSRGGTHDLENLEPACVPCRNKKQAKSADEFLAKMPWRWQPARAPRSDGDNFSGRDD